MGTILIDFTVRAERVYAKHFNTVGRLVYEFIQLIRRTVAGHSPMAQGFHTAVFFVLCFHIVLLEWHGM